MTLNENKTHFNKDKLAGIKEKLTSRKGVIRLSSSFGVLVLVLLFMKACEPPKGTILFGICHAFLELQIDFPETIEDHFVEQYSSGVRIYYSHTDGFGQYLSEFIECSFNQDPVKGLQLKNVIFNTIKLRTEKTPIKNKGRLYEIQKKYIDEFNNSGSIPVIIDSKPDLSLPTP